MGARARLVLVTNGFQKLARKERLIARAQVLFPDNPELAEKWVAARLYVWGRKPEVEIGIQRINTERTVRALPHGTVAETIQVPQFLRRFLRLK